MKIISRRRTITIETCAYRRWQTQGEEGSFSCSNCGMTFKQDLQLPAADTRPGGFLTGMVVEDEISDPSAPEINGAGSACGGTCVDQIGGKTDE